MIKSLYSTSPFITVAGGTPQTTYISQGNGPGVGNLRYNPNSNNIEIFDGTSWIAMYSSSATIGLDSNTINILKWAEKKMLEEAERNKLAETNPTIRDLVDHINQKEEQLSIVLALIKEEVKV